MCPSGNEFCDVLGVDDTSVEERKQSLLELVDLSGVADNEREFLQEFLAEHHNAFSISMRN